jgi:tRNA1(Val) A37 N6-methylase TrmN6
MSATALSASPPPPPSGGTGVPSSLTEDGFLGGRLQILQPEKGFRAGIDSVFLAATIPCNAGESVFEAGVGSNGFGGNVRVIHADIKEALRKDLASMPAHGTFSHAFANPPYFDDSKSTPSPVLLKAQAHAFGPDDLELWIRVMHTMVTMRGTVTLVNRADALGKILQVMDERFGDIRIAPLYAREGTSASRVIVQGVKGSKAPMQLLPGLVLHDSSSQFTPEADAILREGMAWRLR